MIDDIAAGQRIRHRYEIVRVALLHTPKIANGIAVVSLAIRQCRKDGTFECSRYHAVVLRIDERGVDQLAASTKFLILELYAAVSLSEHVERFLIGVQQQRARF